MGVEHLHMLDVYKNLERLVPLVMREDSMQLNMCKNLPDTSTKLFAKYDVEAFLKFAKEYEIKKSHPETGKQKKREPPKQKPPSPTKERARPAKRQPEVFKLQARKRRAVSGMDI